jgi:transcriptional regulator with XRE-family HTH domain
MLAPSSSSVAGKRLRAKRERLHLSIRRVEQISQQIAEEKKDPAFYVSHNWVSDLENGKSKPRLAKFHSLSLIYECDINEILDLFGLNIHDLGKERGFRPATHPPQQADARARRADCTAFSEIAGEASLGADEFGPSNVSGFG